MGGGRRSGSLSLLANTNKAAGGPVVGVEPMKAGKEHEAELRILSPIGERGWSLGLVKRDQPAKGADSRGRGLNALPQSGKAKGGAVLGCPMRDAGGAGLSREGPGGGGMVSRG